jgi:hypothetical protein
MDFDYKKYSLERLEEWVHDAISCSEASPQEIYDVIKGVVEEQYYYFKQHTGRCYELLALLNGNGKGHIQAYDDYIQKDEDTSYNYPDKNGIYFCESDDPAPYCKSSWNDFWENDVKDDKVVKWSLPVQVDGLTGECYVNFPDDLLEAANLKEGDMLEWVDNGNGSFTLKKVN